MRLTHLIGALLIALVALASPARAQTTPRHYLSAASNNATLVLGRSALVGVIHVQNTTATIYYLKLYDKATAPTCGTDTPVLTIPVPALSTGGPPAALSLGQGLMFYSGVGFCLVAGIADNDNANAATGIAINIGITSR